MGLPSVRQGPRRQSSLWLPTPMRSGASLERNWAAHCRTSTHTLGIDVISPGSRSQLIRAKAAPAPLPAGPGGRSERGEAGEGEGIVTSPAVNWCRCATTLLTNIHKHWEGSLNKINYLMPREGGLCGELVYLPHCSIDWSTQNPNAI